MIVGLGRLTMKMQVPPMTPCPTGGRVVTSAPVEGSDPSRCPTCGLELPGHARFCGACGTRIFPPAGPPSVAETPKVSVGPDADVPVASEGPAAVESPGVGEMPGSPSDSSGEPLAAPSAPNPDDKDRDRDDDALARLATVVMEQAPAGLGLPAEPLTRLPPPDSLPDNRPSRESPQPAPREEPQGNALSTLPLMPAVTDVAPPDHGAWAPTIPMMPAVNVPLASESSVVRDETEDPAATRPDRQVRSPARPVVPAATVDVPSPAPDGNARSAAAESDPSPQLPPANPRSVPVSAGPVAPSQPTGNSRSIPRPASGEGATPKARTPAEASSATGSRKQPSSPPAKGPAARPASNPPAPVKVSPPADQDVDDDEEEEELPPLNTLGRKVALVLFCLVAVGIGVALGLAVVPQSPSPEVPAASAE